MGFFLGMRIEVVDAIDIALRIGELHRLCLQDRETCRAEMEKALAELETLLFPYR